MTPMVADDRRLDGVAPVTAGVLRERDAVDVQRVVRRSRDMSTERLFVRLASGRRLSRLTSSAPGPALRAQRLRCRIRPDRAAAGQRAAVENQVAADALDAAPGAAGAAARRCQGAGSPLLRR